MRNPLGSCNILQNSDPGGQPTYTSRYKFLSKQKSRGTLPLKAPAILSPQAKSIVTKRLVNSEQKLRPTISRSWVHESLRHPTIVLLCRYFTSNRKSWKHKHSGQISILLRFQIDENELPKNIMRICIMPWAVIRFLLDFNLGKYLISKHYPQNYSSKTCGARTHARTHTHTHTHARAHIYQMKRIRSMKYLLTGRKRKKRRRKKEERKNEKKKKRRN